MLQLENLMPRSPKVHGKGYDAIGYSLIACIFNSRGVILVGISLHCMHAVQFTVDA